MIEFLLMILAGWCGGVLCGAWRLREPGETVGGALVRALSGPRPTKPK